MRVDEERASWKEAMSVEGVPGISGGMGKSERDWVREE